jgi:hypothetical protein
MLNAMSLSRWMALVGAAGATMLASRQAGATTWVMGTAQYSGAGTYWTEVAADFSVPAAPTISGEGEKFSIWPGLYGQDGTLIQAVLQWNQNGEGIGWTMQNEFVPGSGAAPQYGNQIGVNPGDSIAAGVFLDTANPGSGCVMSTGDNCNYETVWIDLSLHSSAVNVWAMPVGPTWALGTILEAPFSVYPSCANFPYTAPMEIQNSLWKYSSSNTFTSVTPNFTFETPGDTYPFSFTNADLTSPSGGTVFPDCFTFTYPAFNSYNDTEFWFGEY